MKYTNGSMKLRFVKEMGSYVLFERMNTGRNDTRYWVIGLWCDFAVCSDDVSWISGSYFECDSEKEALQELEKKAN